MKIWIASTSFTFIALLTMFQLGEHYAYSRALKTEPESTGWRIEHIPTCGQSVTIRAYVGPDDKLVIACTTDNTPDPIKDEHGYVGKIARLTR